MKGLPFEEGKKHFLGKNNEWYDYKSTKVEI
jgi:hypothetical protein